jgi:hypothetical protein
MYVGMWYSVMRPYLKIQHTLSDPDITTVVVRTMKKDTKKRGKGKKKRMENIRRITMKRRSEGREEGKKESENKRRKLACLLSYLLTCNVQRIATQEERSSDYLACKGYWHKTHSIVRSKQ